LFRIRRILAVLIFRGEKTAFNFNVLIKARDMYILWYPSFYGCVVGKGNLVLIEL
jgi:hypothetical protein